jgi:pimeloyl-ACP methyl ester carboxylesterase
LHALRLSARLRTGIHKVDAALIRVAGPGGWFRRAARLLGILVAIVVVTGLVYEHVSAWRDDGVLTQVGRSVNVGGRSLNLFCRGEGSPTVIFESARLAPGYAWMPVQRGVAAFTRACWYDRATLGWSDAGPDPAWADTAAADLRKLITNSDLQPPFVLVGHSFGGHVIRIYHHMFPTEAAAMIFVDAAHEDAGKIHGMPHRDPPSLPRWVVNTLSVGLGRLGMIRLMAGEPGPPPASMSPSEWDVLTRLRRRRNVLLADAHMGPGRASDDLVRATGGLENMPMIVLTQGNLSQDTTSPEGQVQVAWIDLQRRFAQRSTRGRLVVVRNSGHGIPLEAPDAVIAAVREAVSTVRQDRK